MFLDGTWILPESISTLLGTPWPSHRGGLLLMKTFTVYENAARFHVVQTIFLWTWGDIEHRRVCRLPIFYKLSREKEIVELAVLQAQFRSRVCDASFEIQLFESWVETDVFLSRYNRWTQTSAVALVSETFVSLPLPLFSNRVEFPFPKETPFKSSSPWCKAANNPEYGFRCVVPASVKDKSFQRVFKRHSAKVRNYIQSDDISLRIFHFCVRLFKILSWKLFAYVR